jgi:transposase
VSSASSAEGSSEPPSAARLRCANRKQLLLRPVDLDALISADHLARTIWRLVEGLDLSLFLERIQAREGEPGRDATDPKVLVTLWCYATTQGVGSARELARLCQAHDAYRWICGGVSLNYHTLSDFRVDHAEAVEQLVTEVIAVMIQKGLATVERTAQDGMRVRASAGAASFRREPSLKKCLEAACEQLEQAKKLAEDPALTAAQAAARERAAREREERIQKALEELPKVREAKKGAAAKEEARASTTDPEARVMKMGDGGFRPAYNVQLTTTTRGGVIVGVGVTNVGSDTGQMAPMLEQIAQCTGERPREHLVDGGFVNLDAIEQAAKAGTKVYAPPMSKKKGEPASYEPKPGDSPEVAEWRGRMSSAEAKEIYKERAATAELANAGIRERQGIKLRVRGLKKVLTVVLWHALAYNLTRWIALAS